MIGHSATPGAVALAALALNALLFLFVLWRVALDGRRLRLRRLAEARAEFERARIAAARAACLRAFHPVAGGESLFEAWLARESAPASVPQFRRPRAGQPRSLRS